MKKGFTPVKAEDKAAKKMLIHSNSYGRIYKVDKIPTNLFDFYILKKRTYRDGTCQYEIGVSEDTTGLLSGTKDRVLDSIRGSLEDAERRLNELLGINDKAPVITCPSLIDVCDVELTDAVIGEYDDHDLLCFSLSREKTEAFFKKQKVEICNDDGDEDDSFIEGDLIVEYGRDSEDYNEITLAPVYEYEGDLVDGGIITMQGRYFTPECIKFFQEKIRTLRKKSKKS